MKHIITIALLFCCTVIDAQKVVTHVTYSTENKKHDSSLIFYHYPQTLVYSDFEGNPIDSSKAAAITSAGIGYNFTLHGDDDSVVINIVVYCNFSKLTSWMKPDKKTPYILNHEKHHFDVAYINALLFINKLKHCNFTPRNYKQEINNIYLSAIKQLGEMQNQYDTETQNSIIVPKQEEWNKKIDEEIQSLQK